MTLAPGDYAGLTDRQIKLLSYLRKSEDHGRTPSYQEMAFAIGLVAKSNIPVLLSQLEARGYIERLPGRARSLRLTEPQLAKATVEQLMAELQSRGVIIQGARL